MVYQRLHRPLGKGLPRTSQVGASRGGLAAAGILPRIELIAGVVRGKNVGVEAEHHVGLGQLVARLHVLTEGHLRAGAHVVAVDRIPLVPLRLREGLPAGIATALPASANTPCGSETASPRPALACCVATCARMALTKSVHDWISP